LLKKNWKKLKKREGEKLFREGVFQICKGYKKNREVIFFGRSGRKAAALLPPVFF